MAKLRDRYFIVEVQDATPLFLTLGHVTVKNLAVALDTISITDELGVDNAIELNDGLRSWAVDVSAYVDPDTAAQDAFRIVKQAALGTLTSPTSLVMRWDTGDYFIQGTFIVKSFSVAGGINGGLQFSATFALNTETGFTIDDGVTDVVAFSCGTPTYTLITHTSEQKLVPASLTSGDAMGGQHSVAISGDGLTVAIGASNFENGGTSRGCVFVYTLSAGTWSLQATLVHSAAANSDLLGDGVCISDDGNTVMSSIKRTTGEAIIVWTRSAGVWTQGTSITPTTVSTVASWGNSIAMNNDATRVACTSWGEAGGNRIWVFDYAAGVWSETIVITPTPTYTGNPAVRLNMSADGNYIVAGDPFISSGGAGRGYAHIYYKDQGGTNLWGEQAAFQSQTPANNDNYGRGVAINCDGSVAAFGWPGRTDVVAQAGGVEIYKRTGATWAYSALCDSTSNLTSELGRSVAMSGDGKIVIAGGPSYSSSRGRVHLFNDQNGDNVWTENEWWQMTGPAANDLFGEAVCFPRSSGGYIVVGVPGDDDNGAGCGAAISWNVFT